MPITIHVGSRSLLRSAEWSADGSTVYYVSQNSAGTKSSIWVRPSDGSRDPTKLAEVNSRAFPHYAAPDGRSFVVDIEDHNGLGRRIYRWFADGGGKPESLVTTASDEYAAAVSPTAGDSRISRTKATATKCTFAISLHQTLAENAVLECP